MGIDNHANHTKSAYEILVDGELIYSYPPTIDTMFNADLRPSSANSFGDIFYLYNLHRVMDENLKREFIKDMVNNEKL